MIEGWRNFERMTQAVSPDTFEQLNIAARAEAASGTGKDDDANGIIVGGLSHRLPQAPPATSAESMR